MNRKITEQASAAGEKEFLSKYADKMKAPAGMGIEDIPEESARLGMKVPKDLKKNALSKLAGKAVKPIAKGAAGLASLLMQDELNPEGEDIENPDLPLEVRGAAAIEGQIQAQEEMEEEADFERRKQAREDRISALRAKLRSEAGVE